MHARVNTATQLKEYLAGQPAVKLGTAVIDPQQPPVEFAFGAQPLATRGADILPDGRRRKVGIVGAGDVFTKFVLPTFAQRGTELHICDPNRGDEAVARAQRAGLTAHRVAEIGQLPDDLDYILILTPPSLHKGNVEEAVKKGVPIVVEKPLAGNRQDVEALDAILRDAKAPAYCIDWEVMHALPLLNAIGINMPFADALETTNASQFKNFDFNNVTKIDGRFVEGGDNSLGDIEKVKRDRPWLFDYRQGGGILFDMAVHPLNVLAAMGFRSTGINHVHLGTPSDQKGVYHRFGKEDEGQATGEIYGRVKMMMSLGGNGPPIPTVIEAAKNANESDGRIVLTDKNGNTLHWEMFPLNEAGQRVPGSRLEMRDASDRVVATSSLKTDCYSLVMQDIRHFVDSGSRIALHFPEHSAMIAAVADMHTKARVHAIPVGETVSQLKLESANEQHEGHADRVTEERKEKGPPQVAEARKDKHRWIWR